MAERNAPANGEIVSREMVRPDGAPLHSGADPLGHIADVAPGAPTYEASAQALTESLKTLKAQNEPALPLPALLDGVPPLPANLVIPPRPRPEPAVPPEDIDRVLDALSQCIMSAVGSTHAKRFQSIRRVAKIAELVRREKGVRGVGDAMQLEGHGVVYQGGHDPDLEMDDAEERRGGVMMGNYAGGGAYNDQAQIAREMSMALNNQADVQRGAQRAKEIGELENLIVTFELDLRKKVRKGCELTDEQRVEIEKKIGMLKNRVEVLYQDMARQGSSLKEDPNALVHSEFLRRPELGAGGRGQDVRPYGGEGDGNGAAGA